MGRRSEIFIYKRRRELGWGGEAGEAELRRLLEATRAARASGRGSTTSSGGRWGGLDGESRGGRGRRDLDGGGLGGLDRRAVDLAGGACARGSGGAGARRADEEGGLVRGR